MPEPPSWVVDTSTYTHLSRAGHVDILRDLAPGGLLLLPDDVNMEIERGRHTYPGIGSVASRPWLVLAVLTEDEAWTQVQVKAALGGTGHDNLGECAVIACAYHRGLIALLDDRAAVEQADLRKVTSHNTLWLVIEAHKTLFDRDRQRTAQVVDDLLATDMRLPVESGEDLLSWAYEQGLMP